MKYSLNGEWKYKVDIDDIGENDQESYWSLDFVENAFNKLNKITLPNCWNILPGMDRYEGIMWFFKRLDKIPDFNPNIEDVFLLFKGSNYYTKVWINGVIIGENQGGYNPFRIKVFSDLLLKERPNYIVVRVENLRKKDRIPCRSLDWYNWGGIYRDIELHVLKKERIDWVGITTKIKGDNSAESLIKYEIVSNSDEFTNMEMKYKIKWSLYYLGILSKPLFERKSKGVISSRTNNDNSEIIESDSDDETMVDDESDILDELLSDSDMEISEETVEKRELIKPINEQSDIEGALIQSGTYESDKKKDEFSIEINEPKLWSADEPNLYQLVFELEIVSTDEKNISLLTESAKLEPYKCRFGFREIRVEREYIFINNRRTKFFGTNLHEELLPFGRAIPIEKRREDIRNIKKLGFNALRTAHYPHDESLYEIADEEGLYIFEEIPVYWGIQFNNPDVFKLAAKFFRIMIRRDFNHPSIVVWSAGNEIPIGNRACANFMKSLIKLGKRWDSSRIVTCVLEPIGTMIFPNSFAKVADVICTNQYFGWYYLSAYNVNFIMDSIHYKKRKKPILMTEFGAGAKYGFHAPLKKYKKYSEERQASVIGHTIKVLNSKDYVGGWFIWIYRDFRSHLRTNQYQEGFNRKGLVSAGFKPEENNNKKLIAKWMPTLVHKKFAKKQIKNHKLKAALFIRGFWPLFRFISLISSKIQALATDKGDKYYSNKPESKSEPE